MGDMQQEFHGFVAVQSRGLLALPKQLRERYGLDQPGAQVEITEHNGRLELRPVLPVSADQAWFWSDRWQAAERAVDAHVAAGEVTTHASPEDFLAHIESIPPEDS
jgi:bifunctional DNA-binding transcriptional regulator/antitoxin component of YhaV-PrlF toxin-antitoxin module